MQKLVVSKFGGTSMGSDSTMLKCAQIVCANHSKIAVVSATSGTTDLLLLLIKVATDKDWNQCESIFFQLKEKHLQIAANLKIAESTKEILQQSFVELETITRGVFLLGECTDRARDQILSLGEYLSSLLFAEAIKISSKKEVLWIDIRKVLITDNNFGKASPIIEFIAENAKKILNLENPNQIYVTQGFIGATEDGITTTLGRGGSDYSAALIAEAMNADTLEIWTDVSGIATTDPRICSKAQIIHEITYAEAAEMAYYGAKVLHPTTLAPAVRKDIPVFVGNSFKPEEGGTWIKNIVENQPLIRAITQRKQQALLTISTPKMLNAFGFMGKVFDIFARFHVSIDCVTTSEIAIAISLDNEIAENKKLLKDLAVIGEVKIENGFNLISLIGNELLNKQGLAQEILNTLGLIPIRMLSIGASQVNFNFLIKEEHASTSINLLHQHFIEGQHENSVTW